MAEFSGTAVFFVAYVICLIGWLRTRWILAYVHGSLKHERSFKERLFHSVVNRVTVSQSCDVVCLRCDDSNHANEVFELLSEELCVEEVE